jgi:hypothetical protein
MSSKKIRLKKRRHVTAAEKSAKRWTVRYTGFANTSQMKEKSTEKAANTLSLMTT